MRDIKVKWIHSDADLPVWLYSELDEERYEVRKVELHADGSCGYADATGEVGDTGLGVYPVPPLAEIASNPVFEPVEISREAFERVWRDRHAKARLSQRL